MTRMYLSDYELSFCIQEFLIFYDRGIVFCLFPHSDCIFCMCHCSCNPILLLKSLFPFFLFIFLLLNTRGRINCSASRNFCLHDTNWGEGAECLCPSVAIETLLHCWLAECINEVERSRRWNCEYNSWTPFYVKWHRIQTITCFVTILYKYCVSFDAVFGFVFIVMLFSGVVCACDCLCYDFWSTLAVFCDCEIDCEI